MRTVGAALAAARRSLTDAGKGEPNLDARLLLSAASGLGVTALLGGPEKLLDEDADHRFQDYVARRLAGEPVARILGSKEFWGLPFRLNAATLEPRPDTETLVEVALDLARVLGEGGPITVCDLGTGTGAIAIALLTELPGATAVAVDISAEAVATARRNAEALGVADRISFRVGDFAEVPDGRFDLVVSNPPYVESSGIAALPPEVRLHDPHAALDGGADGLDAYRTIAARADALLSARGMLALEVGHGQAASVAGLCRDAGLEVHRIAPDLAGIQRVVVAGRHVA